MELLNDLEYIVAETIFLKHAFESKDFKLALSCIRSIQNHLNGRHHPLAFTSIAKIYCGCKN